MYGQKYKKSVKLSVRKDLTNPSVCAKVSPITGSSSHWCAGVVLVVITLSVTKTDAQATGQYTVIWNGTRLLLYFCCAVKVFFLTLFLSTCTADKAN